MAGDPNDGGPSSTTGLVSDEDDRRMSGDSGSTAKKEGSFWTSLPGILTGLGGLVTAVGGLLAILCQIGVICGDETGDDGGPVTTETEQVTVDATEPFTETPVV
ncbi:MAG: hypothetical protein M3276_02325, partial [Actinomycetota bacterium]|nr:hypothetical protein [Actinomycetota bacterium]